MLTSCYRKVNFNKADLILGYSFAKPMARPKDWKFEAYFMYIKYDLEGLLQKP